MDPQQEQMSPHAHPTSPVPVVSASSNRSMSLLIVLLVVLIGLLGYLFVENQSLKRQVRTFSQTQPTPDSPVISTVPTVAVSLISPTQMPGSPQPTAVVVSLRYTMPATWSTVRDQQGIYSLGYNPNQYTPQPTADELLFVNKNGYGSYDFLLKPYDGGSRHTFIYKTIGFAGVPHSEDKLPEYKEKEYLISGMKCLVIYGLMFSASGTTWGACPLNSTQAIFFDGPGDEIATEEVLRTLKLLK